MSELAERIKSLKTANSIEATPQRVRQKQSSAEEPVTARIRRRTATVHVADPAIQPDAVAPAANTSLRPESDQNSPVEPQITFRERITMERQREDPEPSLP